MLTKNGRISDSEALKIICEALGYQIDKYNFYLEQIISNINRDASYSTIGKKILKILENNDLTTV